MVQKTSSVLFRHPTKPFQDDWFIARALDRVGRVSEPENGVLQTSDRGGENCYFLPILNLFFYEMPD